VSAGVWWAIFTLVPLRTLRDRAPALEEAGRSVLTAGFGRLGATLRELRGYPSTLRFLVVWTALLVAAYVMPAHRVLPFVALAAGIGLVLPTSPRPGGVR